MKCLITGGAGFLGSHIAQQLAEEGHEIRVLDNFSSGSRNNLSGIDAELMDGDIRDTDALARACRGTDCIFHMAAFVSVFESVRQPRLTHEINSGGTFNVLEAAREAGVRRVILASTAAVYGNNPASPKTEDMPLLPESPYAASKIDGENSAALFASLYGLETVCLRYFNAYGPRQDPKSVYSGVISRFADQIMREETIHIFGDGKQTRDFVFARDIARANLLAMNCAEAGRGEAYNIGTGTAATLLDVVEAIASLTGKKPRIEFHPPRIGDIVHSLPDISRAKKVLGYTPSVALREGLALLLQKS